MQITVLAKNAGVSSLVARAVSVGVTTCVSTTWISGSSIVCRTSEGVGSLIPVVVSVGLQRGVSNNVVSYDSLIISSFLPSNRPTTSAVSITVVGRGMGTFDSSPAASVNDVMSPFTKWIADSNIISKAPYANGISLNVKLSVQSLQGSLVNVNAFDSAVVSAVVPASGSSSGSISITVVGNGLQLVASSVSVRVGRSISPATAWISDSSVAGLIVSGFGGAIDVRASIWRQSGSSTRVWSYNSPTPLSMACNAPDSGAVYVTVVGRDLGTNSWSSVLKLLGSVAECSRWVSECSLVSKTSAGSSRFAPVSVTVALQSSAPQMTLAVTFNAPALSSVRQTMVSSGSNSITVIGKGIGNADVTAMIRAGFSSCERSTWISASSVRCKGQSGSGRSFGIVASSATRAGSLSSAYLYAGYAAALVSFVSVSNSSTTGSVSITVFGGQYSSTDRSHCIRVSSASASLAALWISDSSVLGKVRPGVGLGNPIFVSHGIQASASWSKGFAFDAATLSTMTIANSPASGSASITCFGAGFGVSRFFSARMRLGFSNSAASSWFSDSGMPSKFPRGVGNILPGTVTVGVSRGSSSQLFTYNAPLASNVVANLQPSTGSIMVSLFGASVGSSHNSANVRFGSTAAALHSWTSDSSIRSRSILGLSKGLPASLSVGSSSASTAGLVIFSAPVSLQLNPTFGSASGSFVVTVTAKSLGLNAASQTAVVGFSVGSASIWRSDSTITALVASGVRANLQVVVSAGMQLSAASGSMSYSRPAVLSAGSGLVAASGSTVLLIQGSLIGVTDASQIVRIGISASSMSIWISDSSVFSRARSGFGISRGIEISSGLQVSAVLVAVSFGIPVLSALDPSNLPLTGSVSVTMVGREFGRFSSSAS